MKIGILTFQYGNNYGGLLQAFALCSILKKLGQHPVIINRVPDKVSKSNIKSLVKNAIIPFVEKYQYKSFRDFRNTFLQPATPLACNSSKLNSIAQQLDAVIVGSDQVWRMKYTNVGYNYFLDFAPEDIIKIAYAPSFGREKFDGTDADIEIIKKLLKRFKAVSVREDTGVNVCRNLFDIDAQQLVDPTLLLEPHDYDLLIEPHENGVQGKYIARYFLDFKESKNNLAKSIGKYYDAEVVNIYRESDAPYSLRKLQLPKSKYVYPSFSSWLSGIKNCAFVVTDSFHGVAFSLIFNKPFICISNKQRGLSRMTSLLNLFNLTDRIVLDSIDNFQINNLKPIDFVMVNEQIKKERIKAINYLQNALMVDKL